MHNDVVKSDTHSTDTRGDGNDTLIFSDGSDTLLGGGGDDIFQSLIWYTPADINGGSGTDTIEVFSIAADLVIEAADSIEVFDFGERVTSIGSLPGDPARDNFLIDLRGISTFINPDLNRGFTFSNYEGNLTFFGTDHYRSQFWEPCTRSGRRR